LALVPGGSVRFIANTSEGKTVLKKESRPILPFPSSLSQALTCPKRPSQKKKLLHYPEQKKRRINWTLGNIACSKERTKKRDANLTTMGKKDEEDGHKSRFVFSLYFKGKARLRRGFGGQALQRRASPSASLQGRPATYRLALTPLLPGKCVWISVLFLEGGIEPPPNEKVRKHPNDEEK
jgi:hypothetical protein